VEPRTNENTFQARNMSRVYITLQALGKQKIVFIILAQFA